MRTSAKSRNVSDYIKMTSDHRLETRPDLAREEKNKLPGLFERKSGLFICTMREAQLGNFLEADLCTLMTNKLFNENNKTNINSVQIRNLCFIMLKL